jgi:hypothetical protein
MLGAKTPRSRLSLNDKPVARYNLGRVDVVKNMINRFVQYGVILLACSVAPGIIRPVTVEAVSKRHSLSRINQCVFDPDGYLYLKGSSPEGFADFDHIALLVRSKGPRPPSDSSLNTKDEKAYKFRKLANLYTHSSGRGITFEFETETSGGVSYQFSGKFISICIFAEDETDPASVVAEGRLMKFLNGKEAARADVQLTYSKSRRPRSSARLW